MSEKYDAPPMNLLLPERFENPADGYGFQRVVFEQIASGERPPTVVITPLTRHVGVTKRDTHRDGFHDAVRAADEEGYPTLVRNAGGGATAADAGTFGFSIVRLADGVEIGAGIRERYDEAASLALSAFGRLGVREVEVGEVRDEFCPGDHSLRIGDWRDGMKIVGIAQRVTKRAASVGGIVLVHGEEELADVLEGVYSAMKHPFRRGSVGSLRRAGHEISVADVIEAFAGEAEVRYGAKRTSLDDETLRMAREAGEAHIARVGP
ncbi:MAG: lipoyl protein ligase domain-containing protein [Rubrobacteraceae bacterium]